MPHSSIAYFFIVQLQNIRLVYKYENNPPDGFLEYQRGLHPPPEGSLLLGGGIYSSLMSSPFFYPQYEQCTRQHNAQTRDRDLFYNYETYGCSYSAYAKNA